MDAVCLSRVAGRTAGDSAGTLRSGADRRLKPVANIPVCDFAIAQAGNPDRTAVAHDGFATRVRSDIHSTEGGPGFATETISLYIYRTAFRFFDFGYAAAMSFVLLALTNVISALYIRLLQNKEPV